MKYIIVDTVADELYEREIPDQIPVGILAADLALIDAYDGYKVHPTRPEKAREVANKVLIRLTAAARD